MERLIRGALNRPVTVLMLTGALLLTGLWSLFTLPVSFLPETAPPVLMVSAACRHLPAAEVREALTIPLEDALSSVRGLRRISSVSRDGLASLEMEFSWGFGMQSAAMEAREAIDAVRPALPERSGRPQLLPLEPDEQPLISIGVFSASRGPAELTRLAETRIAEELRRTEGVGTVTLWGGREEEIRLYLDHESLSAAGLDIAAAARALSAAHCSYPAGTLREGDTEYIVRVDGRVKTASALRSIDISGGTAHGAKIPLGLYCRICRARKERRSLFLYNGREGVRIDVRAQKGASPLAVSRDIRRRLARLRAGPAERIELEVIRDRAPLIRRAVEGLTLSAALGTGAALTVLLFILRRFRSACIVTLSLPLCLSAALSGMQLFGISVNAMSLGGLALGIGMVIDNAVVVIDRLETASPLERRAGLQHCRIPPAARVAQTVRATGGATLTSAATFSPLLLLPGMAGALFADLAFSVIVTLLASFPISATAVPVLHRLWPSFGPGAASPPRCVHRLQHRYARLLIRVLRRPVYPALLFVIPLGLSLLLFPAVPKRLLPELPGTTVTVPVVFPPERSLEAVEETARNISRTLRDLPFVRGLSCRAGSITGGTLPGASSGSLFTRGPEAAANRLILSCRLASPAEPHMAARIRRCILASAPKSCTVERAASENLFAPLLPNSADQARIRVYGPTPEDAASRARSAAESLASECGTPPVIFPPQGKPHLRLEPDWELLSAAGLSVSALGDILAAALRGIAASELREDGRRIELRMMLTEKYRTSRTALRSLDIPLPGGGTMPLEKLAHLRLQSSPPLLLREGRRDFVRIELPAGAEPPELPWAETAGADLLRKGAGELTSLLLFSLFLLYLLLGAQFASFLLPLLLLCPIFSGFLGAESMLLLTGRSLNASSGLALLVLLGVSINTSILLFEEYRRRWTAGFPPAAAVFLGSLARFRAILMTTATTVAALLPIAFEAAGPAPQSGLAAASSGALCVATLISLLLTPALALRYFRRLSGKPCGAAGASASSSECPNEEADIA
jgi:multidrug efflux pump subunit AcrB